MGAPAPMESQVEYHPWDVGILTRYLESGTGTVSGG